MPFYLKHYHRSRGYTITGYFIHYTGVAEYCVFGVCTTGGRNHILPKTLLVRIYLLEIYRPKMYGESVAVQHRRVLDFYSTRTIVTIKIYIFQ